MPAQQNVIDCYNKTAQQYAAQFARELDYKHLDRLLLQAFAQINASRGRLLDLGCGPGQTTAFLAGCGVSDLLGVDIAPAMVLAARQLHPNLEFETGDMLQLDYAPASFGSAVAFYAIVHFDYPQIRTALSEIYRVLRPDAELLFCFHVGDETMHHHEFLGQPVDVDFHMLLPEKILPLLTETGFSLVDLLERHPYPEEYPSRRAYFWVRKLAVQAI